MLCKWLRTRRLTFLPEILDEDRETEAGPEAEAEAEVVFTALRRRPRMANGQWPEEEHALTRSESQIGVAGILPSHIQPRS